MSSPTIDPLFPPPTHRAIVVGAGISGLTAAFRLRQQSFDVTVLEATETVGGKMSFYRQEYLLEPTGRAIYTANAEELSVVDFLLALVNKVAGGSMAYPEGVDFLMDALADHLDVKTGSTVTHVEQEAETASVTWTANGTDHCERVDACVIAVEGRYVPDLDPAHRDVTDDQVVADMMPAMEKFLPGISENIVFTHLDRWDPGVAETSSGRYGQMIDQAITAAIADTRSRLETKSTIETGDVK